MNPEHQRPTRRLGWIVILLFFASTAEAKTPKIGQWIRVEAEGVVVFSDAKEAKAVEVTRQLAQFRSVLARSLEGSHGDLPSARVFLLKNASSYDRYARRGQERAYYRRTDFERFIALNAIPGATTRSRASAMQANAYTFFPDKDIFHEFTHYLLDREGVRTPLWLTEGLAEYYASYSTKKGKALIGLPFHGTAAALRSREWIPSDVLFEGGQIARFHPLFYPQSWAIVHYLISGPPERRERLNRYADAVSRGVPHSVAFAGSFGREESALIKEARGYLAQGQISYTTMELTDEEQAIAPRASRLPAAEAMTLVGQLMVASPNDDGSRADQAEALLRQALSTDASLARAHLGLGRVHESREDLRAADASFRKALELAPTDTESLLRFGFNRLNLLLSEKDNEHRSGLANEARSAFRKALEQDASDPVSHQGLGLSYLYEGRSGDEAHTAVRRARELRPVDGRVPVTQIQLLLRDEQEDQADSVLLGVLRSYPVPAIGALLYGLDRTLLLPRDGPAALHRAELRRIAELVLSKAEQPDPPRLAYTIQWTDLEDDLASLRLRLRLFEAADLLAAGKKDEANALISTILEDAGNIADVISLRALVERLTGEQNPDAE